MLRILTFFTLLFTGFLLSAQTGCPGCVLNLPANLPADTIFLTAAPDGTAGQGYSENLSFRLPKTTTPVNAQDPDTPAGLNINQITILGVAGLPIGLEWQASQLTYVTEDETDGCVRFCGVPLFPGLYEIEVFIEAEVFIFTQTTSITIPLVINPAETVTEGFTIVNGTGCGEVTASFVNNIPSNGNGGISYFWDFDNGNSTVSEYPQAQTYTEPGTYSVGYEAIIDTVGFIMTHVTVEQSPCTDLFTSPDMKFVVFDPSGEHVYTAPIFSNTVAPISWDVNIPLGEGNYELHVVDDDGGLDGADDLCGVINFGQELSGTLSAGDLIVTIDVINPIDTVRFSEDITVYPVPDKPFIFFESELTYCEGDIIEVAVINYEESLTWYHDSTLIFGEITYMLTAEESGIYWAVYTSEDGCVSAADSVELNFEAPPAAFELMQEGNLLSIVDESVLPADFSLAWYYEGELIPDATDLILCTQANGIYALAITDNITGCSTEIDISGTYDATVFCTTPAEEEWDAAVWNIYPNPVNSQLFIEYTGDDFAEKQVLLFNLLGQEMGEWSLSQTSTIDVSALPANTYVLLITENGNIIKRERIVVF